MPSTNIRYSLDPTGVNSDNLIIGEIHTLSTSRIRAVATTHGAFFTESLVIYDALDNRQLIRGVDYQCTELLQEATLKFGKEISMVIVITNQSVSGQVRINYQVLGGLYQNPAEAVKNAYENINLDAPVNWIDIINKPTEYPPALHNHLLSDVYGFEALTIQLERIRNAILLSNQPALEAIVEWVKGYAATSSSVLDAVTADEISNLLVNNKAITFERLMQAAKELHFNTIMLMPSATSVDNGQTFTVNVVTTNIDDGTNLFWAVDHITTDDTDFNTTSGFIPIVANQGSFTVSLAEVRDIVDGEKEETFRIAIRKNSVDGPILVKSRIITSNYFKPVLDYVDYFTSCCLYNPSMEQTPESYYVITNKKAYQ